MHILSGKSKSIGGSRCVCVYVYVCVLSEFRHFSNSEISKFRLQVYAKNSDRTRCP